jgi:hypothetical protein
MPISDASGTGGGFPGAPHKGRNEGLPRFGPRGRGGVLSFRRTPPAAAREARLARGDPRRFSDLATCSWWHSQVRTRAAPTTAFASLTYRAR